MARYLCNAPLPGSVLRHNRRIVRPGEEFEIPDDETHEWWERPRAMWIPKDDAAKAAIAKWNAAHPTARFVTKRLNLQNLPPGSVMTVEAGKKGKP